MFFLTNTIHPYVHVMIIYMLQPMTTFTSTIRRLWIIKKLILVRHVLPEHWTLTISTSHQLICLLMQLLQFLSWLLFNNIIIHRKCHHRLSLGSSWYTQRHTLLIHTVTRQHHHKTKCKHYKNLNSPRSYLNRINCRIFDTEFFNFKAFAKVSCLIYSTQCSCFISIDPFTKLLSKHTYFSFLSRICQNAK